MSVKQHYDKHLGDFYAWMVGDIDPKVEAFCALLDRNNIVAGHRSKAIDLGAGHGIQSIALKEAGFEVVAVDFNDKLLSLLSQNQRASGIVVKNDDIRNIKSFQAIAPDVIVCCGDTLTHLDTKKQIALFVSDCCETLAAGGKLIFTFRDYTHELPDSQRFIPVKNTPDRILTCVLEYPSQERVKVTDLLYERVDDSWMQRVSSYHKVRISAGEVIDLLAKSNMKILCNKVDAGMITILAGKEA